VLLLGSAAVMQSFASTLATVGNHSFRSAALAAGESAVVEAKNFVRTADTEATLANRYYPVMLPVDSAGLPEIAWDAVPAVSKGAYSVRHVIERLCNIAPVTEPETQCQLAKNASTGSYKVGSPVFSNTAIILYRVTTQVTGPKNTEVITQAVMAM
jgi:hypothetical protein